MAVRDDILRLVGAGASYETVGRRLGMPAGRAYLVATGIPADGSAALSPEDRTRPGLIGGSTQTLVNPNVDGPADAASTRRWLQRRSAADATTGSPAEPGA